MPPTFTETPHMDMTSLLRALGGVARFPMHALVRATWCPMVSSVKGVVAEVSSRFRPAPLSLSGLLNPRCRSIRQPHTVNVPDRVAGSRSSDLDWHPVGVVPLSYQPSNSASGERCPNALPQIYYISAR
jgi:hypothetical protein